MITSTNNPQVKRIIQLNSKGKARKMARAFVVEGSKMFLEAPVKWIEAIYVSQTFHENNRELLIGRDYEIVSDPVFRHISDTMTPQGILCILKIPEYTLEDLLGGEGRVPFLLVTESIQDPGNLGTMFRTAEGAGVTGILMNHSTVDLFNPKTIRSTMGSIYRVPFCYTEDLGETVTCLQKKGIHFYASHLKGSISYEEENYREPCAFLVGNEGRGLSDETAELADACVRIPMEGQLESLNAAMAAGILLYEGNRQRRKEKGYC